MTYTKPERIAAIRHLVALEAVRMGASLSDITAAHLAAEHAFKNEKRSAYAAVSHGVATLRRRLGHQWIEEQESTNPIKNSLDSFGSISDNKHI